MAAVIVVGPIVVALAATLAVLWPEVPVGPLLVVFVPAGLILPVALYPVSYTMWQAVDLLMRPASPEDFDVAHLDVDSDLS